MKLFTANKPRLETVRDVIESWLDALESEDTALLIEEQLQRQEGEVPSQLEIVCKIRRDVKDPNLFVASVETHVKNKLGRQNYYGLEKA